MNCLKCGQTIEKMPCKFCGFSEQISVAANKRVKRVAVIGACNPQDTQELNSFLEKLKPDDILTIDLKSIDYEFDYQDSQDDCAFKDSEWWHEYPEKYKGNYNYSCCFMVTYLVDSADFTENAIPEAASNVKVTETQFDSVSQNTVKSWSTNNPIVIGDIIRFSRYNWCVLRVRADSVLIVTENIIEKKAYHSESENIMWEKCSLRKYLNGKFYNMFTPEEQDRIIKSNVKNADNQNLKTKTANDVDTDDKIFLLSISEAERFFKNDIGRVATYNGADSWWWLRSPGYSSYRGYSAAFVSVDGHVSVLGSSILNAYGGVRPALWLNLQK